MAEDTETRDRLAIRRTALANERTLLAYIRTAIALAAAGASAIHFLEGLILDVLGVALVVTGVLIQAVGLWRFRRERGLLRGPR